MSEEDKSNLVIVTQNEECKANSALDALADVHQLEFESLMKSNEVGVRKFFQAKGCDDIGEALAMQGVTGSNLHILSADNIDALGLRLGQTLALKNFIFQMKFIAKSKQRVEEIWSREECEAETEHTHVDGPCAECLQMFDWIHDLKGVICRGGGDGPGTHDLPRSSYVLTNSTLKFITSKWADGFPEDEERQHERREGLFCFKGGFHKPPQYRTSVDNIDLCTIEDVDHYVLSKKKKKNVLDVWQRCTGWGEETESQPAEIVVSYVDKGSDDAKARKQAILKVNEKDVEELTGSILAARSAALRAMEHAHGSSEA